MAPPEQPFPVSELETKVLSYTKMYKEKSRKLPRDFDLKRDCELFELVQYSCTTYDQQVEALQRNPNGSRVECVPFARLFRRCGQGDKMFHVETTAWEGPLAWKPPVTPVAKLVDSTVMPESKDESGFAQYGSYFWSNK